MVNKIKQFISRCQDQERHSGDLAPLPPSTGTGRYDSTRTPPPVRPDIEHPLRTQSHSVPASPEPRPGAGRATGGRGVLWGPGGDGATRQHTVLQRHHFEPLASFEKPTPRHSTTWASDTIAKEDKQRGAVGSGRGLGAVELKKRMGLRTGREAGACNECRDQGIDSASAGSRWTSQGKTFPRPAQGSWGEHQRGRRPIFCPSRFMPDQFWTLGTRRATPCCGHGRNLSSIRTCPAMKECQTLVL